MAEKTIALLGQPNSGKSTLFNGLTGSRQHVGNWPGKTVERKDGFFSHNGITYKIVDLPGTYSLSANSDEEVVTRNYISSGEADLVCILADASQLNRSLFMLADYAGIHVPVVLLLNMMDIAEGQGKKINVAGLQKSLGVPVVPMVAADKKQYQPFFNLLENLEKRASFLNAAKLEQLCRKNIGDEYSAILELLPKQGIEIYSASWLAEKLLEQDKLALSFVQGKTEPGIFEKIKSLISCVKDGNLRTADCKFKWIDTLIQENVTSSKKKTSRSRFDKAATSKRWGKPIAIGMIVLGLICSMLIGMPLMELVGALISGISTPLANWLLSVGVGLPWQLFMAFVASAMGKESALGVMASLFNTAGIWGAIEGTSAVDTAALSTNLLSTISQPEALAFLFAFFFNMPCLMALAATAQETHSMKWTVRIALYYILSALILATIAYHVGCVIF